MLKEAIESIYGGQVRVRVMGLLQEKNRILLVEHKSLGRDFLLSPPGGGVQYGETLKQALRREYHEETGLTIEVNSFATLLEFIQPPLHAIELVFKVRRVSGVLSKGQEPEFQSNFISRVAFYSWHDLQTVHPDNLHQYLLKLKF